LFWQLRVHGAIFVHKPFRRKDKYPSFSAKTFGSNHALELEWKRHFKGLLLGPVVQRARRKLTGPRGRNDSVADAVPNLFGGKAAWSRRRRCINGALETPGQKVCNWRIAAAEEWLLHPYM
jgi:hypothetical protein